MLVGAQASTLKLQRMPWYGDYVAGLRSWIERGVKQVWVYEYYNDPSDVSRLCPLIPHAIGQQMRLLATLRAAGLMAQITNPPSRYWGSGLNYYVMARLLWNPDADVDALINDYCRAAFDAGAKPMAEFVRDYERATTLMVQLDRKPESSAAPAAVALKQCLADCAPKLKAAHQACTRPEGRICIERWQRTLRAAQTMAQALAHWSAGARAVEQGDAKAAASEYAQAAAAAESIPALAEEKRAAKVYLFGREFKLVKRAGQLATAMRTIGMEAYAPRLGLRMIPVARNAHRAGGQLALYTPKLGATTRTNKWGVEVIVDRGRVTDVQFRQGNAAIPRQGFVLSGHGAGRRALWQLKPGDEVVLRRIGR